jgi:pyruvate/2-oxoglutarate dehydrogenase complex dihydrolipoamide dehydrogenase (E3) component
VTIVQRAPQLLPLEDLDIAEKVAEILQEDGVEIHFQASPTQVSQTRSGRIALTVEDAASKRAHVLIGTHLLMAVGRVPNTEDLDLSAAGVALTDRGHIRVNEKLETNVPGIYAIGDVKGGPEFTHISYDDFRVIRANLLEGGEASIHDRPIPYTVFIDPQLGRVGLSEKQARLQERRFQVARMPMDYVSRAVEIGQSRGMMKALVDADTDQILGCAILGVEGGEIMAMLEIAMLGKLRFQDLREAIFTHPTLAESLNTLFTMFTDA